MATIVITCESCGARFRLDSDKLNKRRNKVRCSKCANVFVVEQPDEDEDLIHIEISEEETSFFPETDSEDDRKADEPAPENEPVASRSKRSSGKEVLVGAIAAVSLLLIIGVIFGLRGRFSFFQEKKVPEGHVKPDVAVAENLKASYAENAHIGQVLVIEGEVLNKSSRPVSFVMVEGKLFNRKDSVILTQRCYAGNPLTHGEITHLKLSEIQAKMLNREGSNLKDVKIPPAGEVPFLLVFHDLPEISTLSNYSVSVVSSELN